MVLPEVVDFLLGVLVELGPPGIDDRVEEAVGVRWGGGRGRPPSQLEWRLETWRVQGSVTTIKFFILSLVLII